jgi:hypothetical protein
MGNAFIDTMQCSQFEHLLSIFYPHFLKPPTMAQSRFVLFSEILAHTFCVWVLPDSTGAIAVVGFHIFFDAWVYLNDF